MAVQSRLDRVVSVAVIVAAAAILWTVADRYFLFSKKWFRNGSSSAAKIPVPSEPMSLVGAWTAGSETAPAAMIMFSDFQCPFCAKFAVDTLPVLHEEYVKPGKVLLAFRHLPLEAIHPHALPAASAANCAGAQGHFWQYHDELFKSHRVLATVDFGQVARDLAIPIKPFQDCLKAGRVDGVRADQALAESLSLKGTPAFFIGRMTEGQVKVETVVNGARPIAEFRTALSRAISKSQ